MMQLEELSWHDSNDEEEYFPPVKQVVLVPEQSPVPELKEPYLEEFVV
jgi:hypothetical protein